MQIEIWKPIENYHGFYSVSDFGRIRSETRTCNSGRGKTRIVSGKIISTSVDKNHHGYLQVGLSKNGVCKTFLVHTLVLKTFYGERPKGMECAHGDGNRGNAHLNNLRWATPKENNCDKISHGSLPRGESAPWAKLTKDDVIKIKNDTRKQTEIAQDFNILQSTVSRIKSNKRWAHIMPLSNY